MTNAKTIFKNTGWYGIETAMSLVVGTVTSIAIARALGPTKMGYIIYVNWIANIVSNLGGVGIPATVRKYMAEYLGLGDQGVARLVYFRTLMLQMCLAAVVTGGVAIWVLHDSNHDYRLAAMLIGLSIFPAMVNSVSAQANTATEQLSANLPGSISSMIVFFLGIAGTIALHWGVTGFGASVLAMRLTDCTVRLIPTARRVFSWPRSQLLPPGIEKRMMTFAWQSVTSTLVALIVWDRSEFIILKHLCADILQLAFYSVAFNLAERLLLSSTVFGTAIGATIFAQYGRDKSHLPQLAAAAFRYLSLTAIPLHFIAVALAAPVMLLLYGTQYRDAAMVVTIAPILCLPKAFMNPIQSLFQSFERQAIVIGVTLFAGVIDLGTAWLLIRKHGAIGACIGSGAGQFTAIGLLWVLGIILYKIRFPYALLGKVVVSSSLAYLAARVISSQLNSILAVLCGGAAGLMVLFLAFYALRVLEIQDLRRFEVVTRKLPRALSGPAFGAMSYLVRPGTTMHLPEEVH